MTKNIWRRTDWPLILATAAIIIMSLVIIGSATHINTPSEERYWYVQRQGMFALVNVAIAFFLMNFDYKILQGYGNKLYIFNLILLLAVMIFGHSALGAQRWIMIGPISIQPSEFSKLIMIVSIAAILNDRVGKLNSLRDLLPVALYVGIPFILVLKQPDLGTSLVFMAIFFGMVTMHVHNMLYITIVLMCAGFCIYGPQALIGIELGNQATKEASARANGIAGILGYLGSGLSGLIVGYVADAYGWAAVFGTMIVVALIGMLVLISMWKAPRDGYERANSINYDE